MESSYTLPASAMTSHHGHGHIHSHSHSHSPSRPSHFANTPRTLKQERSSGSLHAHARLDPFLDHGHAHSHSHGHTRISAEDASPYPNEAHNGNDFKFPAEKQLYEISPALSSYEPPPNTVQHKHGHHGHAHGAKVETRSRFTSLILSYVQSWPLLHTIMADKDSRRIFYFMSLNFAFMVVQAIYGFLTDSLGLLSDSIHMFFDCLALAVGLFASMASKWPSSERFPYGFGKIESLSGFGNGVFLMLISIEIMIEATERLAEGRETKRLGELFIVSSLGLLVNLVGMACFGHHHHGHDHGDHRGHDHGHSHSHSHSHESDHTDHSDHHSHDHKHTPLLCDSPPAPRPHIHNHSHDNENMRGIFLHVLADTMGSAAVILSTLLIHFVGWSGWDPLASCIIAVLIFMSSIPLVKSSARKLLLTIPDDVEYNLRDTLGGVGLLRGVQSYNVPRFWLGDKNASGGENEQVLGVIHVIATRGSDLDDVRERTRAFLLGRGVDAVVQVEKDGDGSCWCGGGGGSRTPSRFS